MKDEEQNQLLGDIFGDDALAQLRQASLARGLNTMRRRRQRAMAARVTLMILPALLAMMVLNPRLQPRRPSPAPPPMALASKPAPKVEYITADELFALFPNRPMALVGKPGHQKLVFLDEVAASQNQ